MLQEKPTIPFNKAWPAIKLANSRTPKLIGLKMKEINSIGNNIKTKPKEVFDGKKSDNIFVLCILKPIMLTLMKTAVDKLKVTIK